ncbi:metallophosphoesterase [uncultured Sphingomonas sp.]|uniref:metallophosphoesterase n=1 Tax=uncultured Sphingomonas sp. TaxID=158754 RepID=UPI0025D75750|nr:metallophosphoesterase [uncultured Sphingomonas sp.]
MRVTAVRIGAVLLLAALAVLGWSYRTAVADPVVRQATVSLLPPGTPGAPIHLLLLSDIHVAGPDMPPTRLARIVRQANALTPDMVLIAGDFVSDKALSTRTFSLAESIAPLTRLRSRFGTFAVLGNHDHWRDPAAARVALRTAGIHVLDNSTRRVGPLTIGGLDDAFTGHDDLDATLRAMAATGGVPILLSHSPDPFPRLPASVGLMLAGHTHCGQIRLPLIGAVSTMSHYGDRYVCGIVVENGKTLIVGAGLGTSVLPLRLGAVPDMWLITLRPRS